MPLKCIVVTPEKTVFSQDSTLVVLPLADGECGILPSHAPLIARLGAGELRITGTDGQRTHYYVEGGFAEVLDDTVALLTMYAKPVAELDLTQVEAELEADLAGATNIAEISEIRQEKLARHRARVRVAKSAAEKKGNP